MHFKFLPIVLLFHILLYGTPVFAMHRIQPTGWIFPFPNFKDKRFHLGDNAVVYAWPSTGGRLELQNPSAFELTYLGIHEHFNESNKAPSAPDEDAFVLKLRRLGGVFLEYDLGIRDGENAYNELNTWLGWPDDEQQRGGVWVLKVENREMSKKQTGRIRLATTMQDRCRAIELCGGVFYAEPSEEHLVPIQPAPRSGCPDLWDQGNLEG